MKTQEGATSAVIINENNEILFLKRSESDDFMPGNWDVPGGGLDYGEDLEAGLRREVMEECGIEIEILKTLTVSTYFMDEVQRIDVTYLCRGINTENLKLSSEHSDHLWIYPGESEIGSLKLNNYIRKIAEAAVKELSN
jgi:8-oxo-dGTP diphosphatase